MSTYTKSLNWKKKTPKETQSHTCTQIFELAKGYFGIKYRRTYIYKWGKVSYAWTFHFLARKQIPNPKWCTQSAERVMSSWTKRQGAPIFRSIIVLLSPASWCQEARLWTLLLLLFLLHNLWYLLAFCCSSSLRLLLLHFRLIPRAFYYTP